jgi:hypothetical protein
MGFRVGIIYFYLWSLVCRYDTVLYKINVVLGLYERMAFSQGSASHPVGLHSST